jgi:hypothetical protein
MSNATQRNATQQNISGLNKPQLLVALFNNAKNSQATLAKIGYTVCPDKFVLDHHISIFKPKIDEKVRKLQLSEDDAKTILNKKSYIDHVDIVSIKIDFSEDTINTFCYDVDHNEENGVLSSADVIANFRQQCTTSLGK